MLKRYFITFSSLLFVIFPFNACFTDNLTDFDILIKNGKIVDGSGKPGFEGDIRIIGDSIVEIGDLNGKTAAKIIDARGMVVSPGFIDMHTHCDRGLGDPGTNANLNYLTQGVTTVVTGNCGSGTFRVAETKSIWEKQGIGTNAVLLVGFGTVRRAVKDTETHAATEEELEEMKTILRQAMKEGAWGMSSGLQYIPDRYASTEEVIAVTKVLDEFGGIYTSHQRSEEKQMVEATQETIRIGKETGVRVNAAHLKASGKSNWGLMKEAARLINEARSQGIYMTADMYPYDKAAVGPIWRNFNIPNDVEPLSYLDRRLRSSNYNEYIMKNLRQVHAEELEKALIDPAKREQIKKLTAEGAPDKSNYVAMYGWDALSIVSAKKNTHLIGKTLLDVAEELRKDPFEVAADLFIEEKNNMFTSVGTMSEDDMKYAMAQDWLMFSSDGSAISYDVNTLIHPRNYGSFPRVLRKYVREEKVLTLESAIRKMTSLPAQLLNMKKRGSLLVGYKADIIIFDPETIRDNATYLNPHKYSTGIEYVIINGKISIENRKYNSALNGKVLLRTEEN